MEGRERALTDKDREGTETQEVGQRLPCAEKMTTEVPGSLSLVAGIGTEERPTKEGQKRRFSGEKTWTE